MAYIEKTLKHLPHTPGVYIYRDNNGAVLYVGKAIDLFRRVHQYFSRDDAVGDKTALLVSQISSIETIKTPSEFDALLLEASLIRKYLPKYNVISRDDKSPLYIALTLDEKLPRVLFLRKSDIPKDLPYKRALFGPFQSSRTARALMRSLRRIMPYCLQKERSGKPCFYTHLHLCDPCPSVISKMKPGKEKNELTKLYRKQIRNLRDILAGKSTSVLRTLEKEMTTFSNEQKYEEAAHVKNQIQSLYDVIMRRLDPSVYATNSDSAQDLAETQIGALREALKPHFPTISDLSRIECIDIANISGHEATGSLVVLSRGVPENGQYRKFKIRAKSVPNDVSMIAEVTKRRFGHTEWEFPDLLVVDGGKPQVTASTQAMRETPGTQEIPIIGLAKRLEEIVVLSQGKFVTIRLPLTNPAIHILQRIRDEAHRFARSYHHLLRSKLITTRV